MERSATFSPCRRYRYSLWRSWPSLVSANRGYVMFIGLNPSTADEHVDDPTIRRCVAFAQQWGYDALCMVNLFAFRATDPEQMMSHPDPVGPGNDSTLVQIARDAGLVVAAWGVQGQFMGRATHVSALVKDLHCLRITKDGHPAHPLYLPRGLVPVPWPSPTVGQTHVNGQ